MNFRRRKTRCRILPLTVATRADAARARIWAVLFGLGSWAYRRFLVSCVARFAEERIAFVFFHFIPLSLWALLFDVPRILFSSSLSFCVMHSTS